MSGIEFRVKSQSRSVDWLFVLELFYQAQYAAKDYKNVRLREEM